MSNPNTRKSCVVPKCKNTTTNSPEKLFFIVPKDANMRKKWIKAMKRLDPFGDKSTVYCCEDHFDIENDMENYTKFKLVGGRIKLKQGIVPHKFKCNVKTIYSAGTVQHTERLRLWQQRLQSEAGAAAVRRGAARGRGALAAAAAAASGAAQYAPGARRTDMDIEHFIETVRNYPCLWNTTAAEYRDQELKDAAWAEVLSETHLSSVKEVKLKWKKLRDSYRDALKRQSQSDQQGREPVCGAKKNYAWKYMGLMQFLQPHMNARKKACFPPRPASERAEHAEHVEHVEHAEHVHNGHSEESDSSRASSPKRRDERLAAIGRKLDYLCRAHSRRRGTDPLAPPAPQRKPHPHLPDPLDIFFNSMCQSTKRFPYPTQIGIKKALFNAVIEAEEGLVAEQQSYAALWARGGGSSSSSEGHAPGEGGEGGEAGEGGEDEAEEEVKPFS